MIRVDLLVSKSILAMIRLVQLTIKIGSNNYINAFLLELEIV